MPVLAYSGYFSKGMKAQRKIDLINNGLCYLLSNKYETNRFHQIGWVLLQPRKVSSNKSKKDQRKGLISDITESVNINVPSCLYLQWETHAKTPMDLLIPLLYMVRPGTEMDRVYVPVSKATHELHPRYCSCSRCQ